MGGTSCDVCVVEDGRVRRTDSRTIGGRPIQLPMVDVHTVGAGGGSIAWRDSGGALRVGPRSAGAEPGPAAYGRGGEQPTVTDANLALGYLSSDSSLAGGVDLDTEAASAALRRLGDQLGMNEQATAAGIVRVANHEMVRALRVVTIERGIDPRDFALMPFGGAGPMHAAGIAAELEISRLLCPRASGVLSALGLLASERRRDVTKTVSMRELDADRIAEAIAELAAQVSQGLDDATIEVVCEMRYRGQAFELSVPASERPDPADLTEEFGKQHEERYGYRDDAAPVELVNLRVAAVVPGPEPRPRAAAEGAIERSTRRAWFDGAWRQAEVLRGEPSAGLEAEGPCVFELPEATLVLPPGWRAAVDGAGTVIASR
jgi:N-methylhydantoinase A